MKLSHSYSSIKLYEQCPLRYYLQRVEKSVVDTGNSASVHGERIHKYLEERIRDNKELPQDAKHYEPLCQSVISAAEGNELYLEKELVLTEELTPTTWWEPNAWLRSKLDVVIIGPKKAVVMDWKTGKRKPDTFQLGLFAAQVMKHYPQIETVSTSFVWLKDMAMDKEDYHRESINEVWADIMTRIRRIHQSAEHQVWPARPSGLCRWCPARSSCDFAQS